ncbi:htr3c [Pungitius sinensis]
MVASLLETVFITNIQYRSCRDRAVPHWLSVLVLRYLAVVVCLPREENRSSIFLNPSATKGQNSRIPNIPGLHLECLPGDAAPTELDLDELRKVSRDLLAIRLRVDQHFQGGQSGQEWQMVGRVIDRLLFGFSVVFITFSFVTIACIWTWSNSYAP